MADDKKSDKIDDGKGNLGLICEAGNLGAIFGSPNTPHFKHTYMCTRCTSRWMANELIPCPVCGLENGATSNKLNS